MFALISRMLRLSGRLQKTYSAGLCLRFCGADPFENADLFCFSRACWFCIWHDEWCTLSCRGRHTCLCGCAASRCSLCQRSAAERGGYMIFADQRIALADHLRRLPMGYFTAGNIGKISSVLSSDMVFVEEVAMSTIANMMSYLLSAGVLMVFMFWLDWRLGSSRLQ